MNDFDRYDAAVSLVAGAIGIGALGLYPHLWIVLAICPIPITVCVLRHFDFEDLVPDEADRPRRLIVLIRAVNEVRNFGSRLRFKRVRKEPHSNL
jgi:hypothetical protein